MRITRWKWNLWPSRFQLIATVFWHVKLISQGSKLIVCIVALLSEYLNISITNCPRAVKRNFPWFMTVHNARYMLAFLLQHFRYRTLNVSEITVRFQYFFFVLSFKILEMVNSILLKFKCQTRHHTRGESRYITSSSPEVLLKYRTP
jgi:hypothetical protein